MIDPKEIGLLSLPFVSIENRLQLPSDSGIYFAIDGLGCVQYIGKASNLKQRWSGHHKHDELSCFDEVRIAWLSVSDVRLLCPIEAALIHYFKPPLNRAIVKPVDTTCGMRGLRERIGITTVDIASKLGRSEATIRFWESGKSIPTFDVREIPIVLSVYQCTLEEMIEAVNESQTRKHPVSQLDT